MAMLVFTENWKSELESRYRNHKRYTKPFIYFVATENEFQSIREQLEEWVSALPEDLRKERAIKNLRSEESFRQTYHELAVGALLKNSGLKTEYDKEFNGKTPDWFISSNDGSQDFIVEVFTENISQSAASWDTRLSDLQGRLSDLPFDFALCVDVPFDWNPVILDSRRSKTIAEGVRAWLANNNPSVGEELHLDEFSFEVILRDRGCSKVKLMGFARPFWVNPRPLKENIAEKVHKYKVLVTANRIPFVVAVVMEFRTGYGADDLENILFGQDGLFKNESLLSGVILASRSNTNKWEMKCYLSLDAQNPLPANLFNSGLCT